MVKALRRKENNYRAMGAKTFEELLAEGLLFMDDIDVGLCILISQDVPPGLVERRFYTELSSNEQRSRSGMGRFVPIWVACLVMDYRSNHMEDLAGARFRIRLRRLQANPELCRALEAVWRLDGQTGWEHPSADFWAWWREHVDA